MSEDDKEDPKEGPEIPPVEESKRPKKERLRRPPTSNPNGTPTVFAPDPEANVENLRCFPQVLQMLKAGAPLPRITKFIQQDQKEWEGVEPSTASQRLYRYTKKMPMLELIEQRVSPVYSLIKHTVEEIDELEAMVALFHIQFDRIMVDYQTEKTLGKLFSGTGNEIGICKDILKSIGDLKVKLIGARRHTLSGLNQPSADKDFTEQNKQLVESIRTKIEAKYGNKLTDIVMDPVRRRKLLQLHERIYKLGDANFTKIIDKYKNEVEKVEAKVNPVETSATKIEPTE